ncbi:metallophosphoesterase family protein [Halovulum sp. GXIMD14794]
MDTIRDIGALSGEVLIFGGPYSNLQATEALIACADALGIPPERMVCTGDVVAYAADPEAVVARIRALGCLVVAGNCEVQLGAGQSDCGCGFDDGSACDLLSRGWYAHADAALSEENRDWMRGLPDVLVFHHAGRRCAVVHGGGTANNRFLWPTTPDVELADEWAAVEAIAGPVDRVISGHSGVPFVREVGAGDRINAGVIGMPPHDGAPETRFALIDTKGRVEVRKLSYDHSAARAAMEAAGLMQGYHAALTEGWWPSEDVLPPDLRR